MWAQIDFVTLFIFPFSCVTFFARLSFHSNTNASLTSHMGGVLCRKLWSVLFDYYRDYELLFDDISKAQLVVV